jgi:hypothetical protein
MMAATCHFCGSGFSNTQAVTAHLKSSEPYRDRRVVRKTTIVSTPAPTGHQCRLCGERFVTGAMYLMHVRACGEKKPGERGALTTRAEQGR